MNSVIAIVGPTAVGKSSLAFKLAPHLKGEIISADAMQVYRGMDIGTAKDTDPPTGIILHGTDLTDVDQPYSVALYQSFARSVVDRILKDERTAIICGGTGLYVDSIIKDLNFKPGGQEDPTFRLELEHKAEVEGYRSVYNLLVAEDPRSAELIHPRNTRRVIRALEMARQGISYATTSRSRESIQDKYSHTTIGLTMDRAMLYRRIDQRVINMVEAGLLNEIENLLNQGYEDSITALQAIGYKEFIPVLKGEKNLETAIAEVQRSSRRYAKRQLTWFRRSVSKWIDVSNLQPESILQRSLEIIGEI